MPTIFINNKESYGQSLIKQLDSHLFDVYGTINLRGKQTKVTVEMLSKESELNVNSGVTAPSSGSGGSGGTPRG